MTATLSSTVYPALDLAGYFHPAPTYFQTRQRFNYLVDRYLSPNVLSDRLTDLPDQFKNPQQRPWERFDWRAISPEQIVGVDPDLFISLIVASAEVEAPIRTYAETTRNYLKSVHPDMTRFISGAYDDAGELIEVGVWEKEERQHSPIFCRLYQQLTGEKLIPKENSVTEICPEASAGDALYTHAVRRITTEWSAVSVYLWLMAHSTGALQQAIAQPLQDEVNHLAKFWGMTRWGFGDHTPHRLVNMTTQLSDMFGHHEGERSTSSEILQLGYVQYGIELGYGFTRVLRQLCKWNTNLQPELLVSLFGPRPVFQAAG
ncbi:MAG: hypothetical protein AAFP03_06935 [Cyanobacteria bacterium J06598_3]